MKKGKKLLTNTLLLGMVMMPVQALAFEKEEMVYSNLDLSGASYKTVVSNHLSRLEKGEVDDETELKNILNLNGNENYITYENGVTWNSEGKDIYYQGETSKELPIQTKITYLYNGEEHDVKEILGREGHVELIFEFTNQDRHSVYMNHRYETLYTPFVTMIGTMLDASKISNVEISSGKVVSSGNKYMVVGLALPGMYESLQLDTFKDAHQIRLEFDTTCFEMKNIYIVSTPKLLEDTDLQVFDTMDEVSSNIYTLQNSMNQLEEGAKSLRSGVARLKDGSGSLYQGASQLRSGTSRLQDGTKTLNEGLKSTLEGAKQLEKGSADADENLKLIIQGLQKSQKDLSTQQEVLKQKMLELATLQQENEKAIKALEQGNQEIKQTLSVQGIDVKASEKTIKETVTQLVTSQVTSELQSLVAQGELDASLLPSMIESEVKKQVTEKCAVILPYKKMYDTNSSMIQLIHENDGAVQMLSSSLNDSVKEMNQSLKELEGYLVELEEKGTKELATGAASLRQGIEKLYGGSSELRGGLSTIVDGVDELVSGTKTLSDGANELDGGASTLSDGASRLNQEGILKLSNYVTEVKKYADKTQELIKLSKDYSGFASSHGGSTMFVSITKSAKTNCKDVHDVD